MINNDVFTILTGVVYPFKPNYDTNYILSYYRLDHELKKMIDKSGYKSDFTIKYRKSLKFLELLKENCFENSKLFEILKGTNGINSIILFGDKNIRILFIFLNINNINKPILLHAFEEKDPSYYNKAISIAKDRKNEIIKHLEDN